MPGLGDLRNRDVIAVTPDTGSVGGSGGVAPRSRLANVLLGQGEAFHRGARMSRAEALKRAGLQPVRLSFKEGLALNYGTPQL